MLYKKTTKIGLLTNYDPGVYPGVRILYFWNKYKDGPSYGICKCTEKCNGKGDGTGNGKCKKVTIPVFSSGSVLITGGNTEEQVIDAHNHFNMCIRKIYKDIVHFTFDDYKNIVSNNDYKNSKKTKKPKKPKKLKTLKKPKKLKTLKEN
jgi:hypothetical protein